MKFFVWSPDQDEDRDDAREIEADAADTAAVEWVDLYEQENLNFSVANGGEICVVVLNQWGTEWKFTVTGEVVPHYWITKCV